MKIKYLWLLGSVILFLGITVSTALPQDDAHQTAMSALANFFADPTARADFASKNPPVHYRRTKSSGFSTKYSKRLEKVSS